VLRSPCGSRPPLQPRSAPVRSTNGATCRSLVHKLDSEGLDPFDPIDEIEQSLVLDISPALWPIGGWRDLLGTYELFMDAF
jgi:peptide subunit release factor RF-3